MKYLHAVILFLIVLLIGTFAWAEKDEHSVSYQMTAKKVVRLPNIDGEVDNIWAEATQLDLEVKPIDSKIIEINQFYRQGKETGVVKVQLKALHDGKSICFLARWPDSTKNDQHIRLKWDKEKEEYVKDESSTPEDRFAFAFGVSANFCACMVAAQETIHDIWHWKAYRTNTMGFLDDKRHLISLDKTLRASEIKTPGGTTIWLKRPRDRGSPPYKLTDSYEYQGDTVPKYQIQAPTDSAADVKGKGVWKDGWWTLEAVRVFDTKHDDDYQFLLNEKVKIAVAVFNNTVAQFHSTSGVIELELEK